MSEQPTIYEQLCAPFAEGQTFTLNKSGQDLTYVTGEAVNTRLNTVLGVDGWTFDILEHGHDERHAWALGKLTVYFETRTISRSQFGECALNKGLSLGDGRKGAATDAMKRCAATIGVGLYLSHKIEVEQATRPEEAPPVLSSPRAVRPARPYPGGAAVPARTYSEIWQDAPAEEEAEIGCADCGTLITPWRRKDGTTWTARDVAEYAQRKFGKTVCWSCGKKATG